MVPSFAVIAPPREPVAPPLPIWRVPVEMVVVPANPLLSASSVRVPLPCLLIAPFPENSLDAVMESERLNPRVPF